MTTCDLRHVECFSINRASRKTLAATATAQAVVMANPKVPRRALQDMLARNEGMVASSATIGRVRRDINDGKKGDVELDFQRLVAYLRQLEEINPGSHTDVTMASDGTFQTCFVMPAQAEPVCPLSATLAFVLPPPFCLSGYSN